MEPCGCAFHQQSERTHPPWYVGLDVIVDDHQTESTCVLLVKKKGEDATFVRARDRRFYTDVMEIARRVVTERHRHADILYVRAKVHYRANVVPLAVYLQQGRDFEIPIQLPIVFNATCHGTLAPRQTCAPKRPVDAVLANPPTSIKKTHRNVVHVYEGRVVHAPSSYHVAQIAPDEAALKVGLSLVAAAADSTYDDEDVLYLLKNRLSPPLLSVDSMRYVEHYDIARDQIYRVVICSCAFVMPDASVVRDVELNDTFLVLMYVDEAPKVLRSRADRLGWDWYKPPTYGATRRHGPKLEVKNSKVGKASACGPALEAPDRSCR